MDGVSCSRAKSSACGGGNEFTIRLPAFSPFCSYPRPLRCAQRNSTRRHDHHPRCHSLAAFPGIRFASIASLFRNLSKNFRRGSRSMKQGLLEKNHRKSEIQIFSRILIYRGSQTPTCWTICRFVPLSDTFFLDPIREVEVMARICGADSFFY